MADKPVVRFFKDPGKDGPKIDFKDRDAEIGAIWRNKSKAGGVYYTGTILGERVIGFPVKKEGNGNSAGQGQEQAAAAPAGEKAPWD